MATIIIHMMISMAGTYDYDYDGYYYGNYYSGCNYYRHRWYVTHNRYWLRRYYQCLDY